jgi:hypothetical protein
LTALAHKLTRQATKLVPHSYILFYSVIKHVTVLWLLPRHANEIQSPAPAVWRVQHGKLPLLAEPSNSQKLRRDIHAGTHGFGHCLQFFNLQKQFGRREAAAAHIQHKDVSMHTGK